MATPVRCARILPPAGLLNAAVLSLCLFAGPAGAAPVPAADPAPAAAPRPATAPASAPAPPPSSAASQPFLPGRMATALAAAGSVQPGLGSPRAAVQSYIVAARAGNYTEAARYLDLSEIPEEIRAERGPRLAREMKIVLDQKLWIDLEALSDRPDGVQDDGLDPRRERVGVIEGATGIYDITLRRTPTEGGEGEWRFSPGTLERIERLYAEIGYGPILNWVPDWATRMRLGNVMLWQWMALIVLAALAAVLSKLLTRGILALVFLISRRTDPDFQNRIVESARPPLRLAAILAFVVIGAQWLRLSVPAKRFLGNILIGLLLVLLTWMALRLIDFATSRTLDKLAAQGRRSGVTTLILMRRMAKAVVLIVAGLAGMQNLGFNISGLLAGFGIAGAAVALAAQKTIENLFGGIVLSTDEPVRIGDLCRFGDKQGTVEDIGLRSTRIRTADRSVVSVPNAVMSTVQIENLALRDRFLLLTTLRLRAETTVGQLTATLDGIREALAGDPRVSPNEMRVRFIGFGDYSLDIEIYAYVLTTEQPTFYEIREDLLLRIMKVIAECGPGLALPSQTLYMSGGRLPEPPPPDKTTSGT